MSATDLSELHPFEDVTTTDDGWLVPANTAPLFPYLQAAPPREDSLLRQLQLDSQGNRVWLLIAFRVAICLSIGSLLSGGNRWGAGLALGFFLWFEWKIWMALKHRAHALRTNPLGLHLFDAQEITLQGAAFVVVKAHPVDTEDAQASGTGDGLERVRVHRALFQALRARHREVLIATLHQPSPNPSSWSAVAVAYRGL